MKEVLKELLESLRECATTTELLRDIDQSKSIKNHRSKQKRNLKQQRREEEKQRSRLTEVVQRSSFYNLLNCKNSILGPVLLGLFF